MKKHKNYDAIENVAELKILYDSEDRTMEPVLIIKDPQTFASLQDGDKVTLIVRKTIR